MYEAWPVIPEPASCNRKISADDITPSPSRSVSKVSSSVPSSAVLGIPSGPTMNALAPTGRSRSARASKHVVPPRTSLEAAVRQRCSLALLVGVLSTVSLVRNVKLELHLPVPAPVQQAAGLPAATHWELIVRGNRLPRTTVPPAGNDKGVQTPPLPPTLQSLSRAQAKPGVGPPTHVAAILGEVMQSTPGSCDVRMKERPVRFLPLFWTLMRTSPVSPGSGKGSWSPSTSL